MSEMDSVNKIRELRDAFGSFMTGVTVVTTCKDDGTPLGFTANSFASVSLDPALLLVSIAKTSSNYNNFANASHFAINILAEEQKDISNTFARPSDDRFANLAWTKSASHNPIIDQVSAWFDCTTYQVVDAGDHAILIGKVEDFGSAGFAGLGYYRGAYFTPAKSSTDVISSMKVMMMALIGHENQILLEQTQDQKWTLPHLMVEKDGAEKALEKIFAAYQPEASPSFIYSVYDDVTTQQQYIAFLCNTPIAHATKGQFVDLNDLEQLTFVDSALESMLMRYRKENHLKTYGVYYGNQISGTVRQIVKEEV
ncbi:MULTISPECIES: flavin-dependent trigonelline monooxygenase reductase component [Acinetobacter]|uniref:flavin-dependent trigonelline monooxygenase reductase component n=1 Tax=Acinetobacter TaxID=469 RepID=UPI0015B42ACF|nr:MULTISPECIES: flavin-dependent trigonelline monooxygenase reductase component [Acinetobacter]MBT0888607.1 flavin reductase family protein [Acinetobacter towneri]MDV2484480.1 flavin reductase family protein [Acinetobacter towneri]NWJ94011.1 flavin reductase family protein [Acinetobacter sp. Swhac1]UIZ58846.1 flavin reductase family protein [Acinetobacter sp. SCLZS86]WOE30169.1 flavin reductase family protein [Acinetobacter towneri]